MKYPIKHRASREGYDWPIRWEHERDSDRIAKRRNTEERSGPKGKSAGRRHRHDPRVVGGEMVEVR